MLLTAARIHDGRNWLPEGTVIETGADGAVIALHGPGKTAGAVFYEGVLAPGFVNAHCHLELSHMKGVIPEHTGLVPFLQQVMFKRNGFSDEDKKTARQAAYETLVSNGVVAVGDIANGTDTLDLRMQGALHIHTFVEAIGFTDTRAQDRFNFSKQVWESFSAQKSSDKMLRQSIVPHAPYSVSEALFRLIDKEGKASVLSIHNQETAAEDQYYISKEGAVNDLLASLNIDAGFFRPSGKSSLKTYIEWIAPQHPTIFVHNTFTAKEDLHKAQAHQLNSFWCLCPNANLYIENRLPDVPMMVTEGADICIGTDSLSSNHGLSVMAELATLKQHFPQLDWETLLRWGTYNGARALDMQREIGTIAPGMKPGIVRITGLESAAPAVKRIL